MENTIGERIKRALQEHNLSESEFGNRLGISRQAVSQVILGQMKLNAPFIIALAHECPQSDMRWVLTGEKSTDVNFVSDHALKPFYNPMQAKDEQIKDLHEMIKALIRKIPDKEASQITQV